MDENKKHISETVKIRCRVAYCKMELLRRNYKQPLRRPHPKEDSSDLTPFGQSKVSDMFKPPPRPPNEKDQADTDDNEQGDSVYDNSRKRKHYSGESTDSGVGEL